MNIRYTLNKLTDDVSELQPSELITSTQLVTYVGSQDVVCLRIANFGDKDATLDVTSISPFINVSRDKQRGYSQTLTISVAGQKVSECVFIRLLPSIEMAEVNASTTLNIGNDIFTVNYFVAGVNEGETSVAFSDRFSTEKTDQITSLIEKAGDVTHLIRFIPNNKPLAPNQTKRMSIAGHSSLYDVAQWCSPANPTVGYRASHFYVKAFVGAEELVSNMLHNYVTNGLEFGDHTQIIIPASFVGFLNGFNEKRVLFYSGLTTPQLAFQHTCWAIKRNDGYYHLSNLKRLMFFNSVLLAWSADLVRINEPGASSDVGYLPWNILYGLDRKPVDYIKPFVRVLGNFDTEDPYQVPSSSSDDPYCSHACVSDQFAEGLSMAVWNEETQVVEIKGWTSA